MYIQSLSTTAIGATQKITETDEDFFDSDARALGAAEARKDYKQQTNPWRYKIAFSLSRVLAEMVLDECRAPGQVLAAWMLQNCRGKWSLVSSRGTGLSVMCLNDEACARRFLARYSNGFMPSGI